MTEPSRAVFLSYASQDAEAARRICDALRAAGIEVWFDQSELRGGDAWDQKIRQQIRDCVLFVPIISANADARTEGYFRLEWKLAVERSRLMADDAGFLVPVVIDTTPDAAARVPDKFREVQWTRLAGGETPPGFVQRVSHLLSPGPHVGPTSAVAARPVGASSRSKPALPLILAALVIGCGYFVVAKFFESRHVAEPPMAATILASPAQSTIPEKSIAVLPFLDMSEKHDQEYFSDGLTEALIDLLAQIPDLHVPARTSSFYFKGKPATVSEIAKALNVAHVLEGSVRRSGNMLRVTAQLIRAKDGYHLWSQTFDHKIEEIFKMQDDIANSVAQVLKVKLQGGADKLSTSPIDLDAYTLFLEGRSEYLKTGNRAITLDAISKYRRALEIAPDYAPAWVALSSATAWAADNYWLPPVAALKDAKELAEHAVQLAPQSPDARVQFARILREADHDYAAAEAELAKAVKLDPSGPVVLGALAENAKRAGEYEKAIALYQQALRADPLSISLLQRLGDVHYRAGNLKEAERIARQVLALDAALPFSHAHLSFILSEEGRGDEALKELQTELAPMGRLAGLVRAYHALGRQSDAESAMSEWERQYGKDHATGAAMLREFIGDRDAALHWVDVAISKNEDLTFIKSDRSFAQLRMDPRYDQLRARIDAQSK